MSEEMSKLSLSLGQVQGKLDLLIDMVKTGGEQQDERHETLARRVGKIENRQHWYSGAAAALGAVFGLVVGRH